MIYLLILFPLVMAAVDVRRAVQSLAAVAAARWAALVHLGSGCCRLIAPATERAAFSGLDGWLLLDALGKLVLGFLSVLFFLCSLYAPGYLALRSDRPNRVFCANLLRRRWR